MKKSRGDKINFMINIFKKRNKIQKNNGLKFNYFYDCIRKKSMYRHKKQKCHKLNKHDTKTTYF